MNFDDFQTLVFRMRQAGVKDERIFDLLMPIAAEANAYSFPITRAIRPIDEMIEEFKWITGATRKRNAAMVACGRG